MVGPDIQVGCVGCSWVEHCETSALAYHFRVLVDGVLVWWCVGVGRHAVGLWENRPARSLGVWLLSLSTAMDCCSLCWGWWFGCVVVVCFVNSGREHLAATRVCVWLL